MTENESACRKATGQQTLMAAPCVPNVNRTRRGNEGELVEARQFTNANGDVYRDHIEQVGVGCLNPGETGRGSE